ncbi:MAG: DUF177 domain-containing protein [Acidobacteriia bacterium]|nr:DUF177 domain-containing protein [Terriglobia bacterium]
MLGVCLFFDVKELELRKVPFQASLEAGAIEWFDEKLKQTTAIEVTGTAEFDALFEEIRVYGHLAGTMGSECDRCLAAVELRVDDEFDLRYRPVHPEWETAGKPETPLDEQDVEVGFYEGAGVALEDIVREQVLLSLPMQRLCRPECKGICPQCGENRNEKVCGCRDKQVDERWAALKNI